MDGAVDTKSSLALALSRVSSPVFILCTAVTRMIKVLGCRVSHELHWKLARETPVPVLITKCAKETENPERLYTKDLSGEQESSCTTTHGNTYL